MNAIKMILSAGAVLAATGIASAQPAPREMGRAGIELTRDQAVARADARFQRMDANRDGRVTADELRQGAAQRMAQRQERGGARRAQLFDRLDANRDGLLSREEFAARGAVRGDRAERQGRRGMRGMRGMRGGEMGGRMAGRMLGEDGVITAAEFRAQALQRFERMDANNDGRINADERRGGRRGPRGPAPAQN